MKRPGLGLGLDTPWDSPLGFQSGQVGPALRQFLKKNLEGCETFFFSFQRRNYGALKASDYVDAFRGLHELASQTAKTINLHHTMLNLGSSLPYNRADILRVTNELCEKIPFGWINEDVGIWFLEGKSVPYPLPPILTEESLKICVDTVKQVRAELQAPLSIEIPGITDGASFQVGHLDLYDYFAELADQSQSLVTLDTGHLLGWEWMQGRREDEMYRHLENFPFHQVIEIHMAGSESSDGAFFDRHHGVLLPEQFELLDFLMDRCPNLKTVTLEDPRFDMQGNLFRSGQPSFDQLKGRIECISNKNSPILSSQAIHLRS